MGGDSVAASLGRKWGAALWGRHSLLGIFNLALQGHDRRARDAEPFTLSERCLCLAMGLGCTWLSVWLKHGVREATDFPEGWDNCIDSALCAAVAAAFNLAIGKSLVKLVLKKDWDKRGGLRSCLSAAASCWAVVLSAVAVSHAARVAQSDTDTATLEKLFCKWRHSVIMHMLVMEPAVIAMAVLSLSARQNFCRRCARLFRLRGFEDCGDLEEPLLTNEVIG